MKTGMVLGKFMPPHNGHQYLFRFARAQVQRLYIIVERIEGEPISAELRRDWVQQMNPDCDVLLLDRHMPQAPELHPTFWDLWRQTLQDLLPAPVNLVFASEAYGHRLAEELGAGFVPADPGREIVPVSGTRVRADPYREWAHLTPPVRLHYLRRVSVFGPESTGKTTLAGRLAQAFETVWVPEYARTFLEAHARDPALSDMATIARGQLASEAARAPFASRVLLSDTDALATQIWSEVLFGEATDELTELAARPRPDLTLLLSPDVPWVDDPVRYLPDGGQDFFDRCTRALEANGRRVVVLRGGWDARFEHAQRAVQALLQP